MSTVCDVGLMDPVREGRTLALAVDPTDPTVLSPAEQFEAGQKRERRSKLAELRGERPVYDGLILVGVGGNYWYAERYLLARLCSTVKNIVVIDPDHIEPHNWGRQWVGARTTTPKVDLAAEAWGKLVNPEAVQGVESLVAGVRDLRAKDFTDLECQGLLIVCLPDNDQARLDTCVLAEDLLNEGRANHVAVLVAGTDIKRGQSYYGIATRQDSWLHDFRTVHEGEIENDGGRTVGCGQVAMSNFMTGICIGYALDEILTAEGETISEWYWDHNQATRQTRIHRREV